MNTMALTFDTLQYAKKLQKAGFTEEQAEIQVETFKEQTNVINDWIDDNLATKQDMAALKQDIAALKQDMATLKQDLNNRINEMGYQITIRLGSMIIGAVVTLGVLIPLMLKFLK